MIEATDNFEKLLRQVTEAGYANGFLACVMRIGEEAFAHPDTTLADLFRKLSNEAKELPGFKAAL